MIDLRSDTVTKPTREMLEAMIQSPVGDDVFEEDATMNAFQQKMAHMFGFEAGLFVPSGVMGNQISLNVLTEPGDEVIIEENGHVFNYETTSAALISSIQLRAVKGTHGKLNANLIRAAIRPPVDWMPHSKAIVIENTTNKGGGTCYTKSELQAIRVVADEIGLMVHLDGARIWNAMEATGIAPSFFSNIADTVSVCFSKGLGAPVGSMILSTSRRIKKARRVRKMLGGGMRQIGLLAAAADYAVENHRSLLKDDHRRARALAETIADCNQLSIDLNKVETNILIFEVLKGSSEQAVKALAEKGALLVPFGPKTLRATFHFQVTDEDLERTQKSFTEIFK